MCFDPSSSVRPSMMMYEGSNPFYTKRGHTGPGFVGTRYRRYIFYPLNIDGGISEIWCRYFFELKLFRNNNNNNVYLINQSAHPVLGGANFSGQACKINCDTILGSKVEFMKCVESSFHIAEKNKHSKPSVLWDSEGQSFPFLGCPIPAGDCKEIIDGACVRN